ncbi:MAG TPA: HWE histidine kinase domain-containing protein [Caulobacteraceae bacterium]|jgi:PAS domain S-box-containing protein|nr:HWE histidine kinase domain-containing protein [Caulobacteraceae bacterium]
MSDILQRLFRSVRRDPDGMRALQAANARLQAEIDAHQATVAALAAAHATLELQVAERVEDIRILNERFAAGLRNSPVTLVEQDEALRYTWVFNPPAGLDPQQMVGHQAYDFTEPHTADLAVSLRREAMASGEPRQAEMRVERGGEVFWYMVRVQPTRLRDGCPGVIASSVDITAQKHQQEHLELVTRELNHRSKNLLTIVLSIARQTAAGLDVPPAFLGRLSERLGSLAAAHDVLVEGDWRGADLHAVIESQLRHLIQSVAGRIRIVGEGFELSPEMAHYVGLAIHELGANAAKYGALSTDRGQVVVEWAVAPGAGGESSLRIDWRETGGPRAEPPSAKGFGCTILEVLAPRALGGTASLRFAEEGVAWSLEAPLAGLVARSPQT